MNVTDRELLDTAAKAAGLTLLPMPDNPTAYPRLYDGVWWNPLADDGDALRLAVKLNIWPVRQYSRPSIVVQRGAAHFDELAEAPIGDDAVAATRRAIVLAASALAPDVDRAA